MADGATTFLLQSVETRVGPLALVTIDNGEDWQKPNVFGRAAFASLADFIKGSRHLATPGGIWLAMKGKLPLDEIATLPSDFQVFHVERLEVPGLAAERCLIWIRKSAVGNVLRESGRLQ